MEAIDGYLAEWHPFGADIFAGAQDKDFRKWSNAKYGKVRMIHGKVTYTRKGNQIVYDVNTISFAKDDIMILNETIK